MIVYKYFLVNIWRVKWSALIYLIMFLALSAVSTVSEFEEKEFKATLPKIAVVKASDTEAEKRIEAYLDTVGNLKKPPKDRREAKEMIFLGEADAVVLFDENMEKNLSRGIPAAEILFDINKEAGHLVENRVRKYLMLMDATESQGEYDFDRIEKALQEESKISLLEKREKKNLYSQGNEALGAYYNFAGYILMAIYLSIIGMVMSDLQEKELSLRIDTSAKSTIGIQTQIYLAQSTLMLLLTVFLTASALVMARGRIPIAMFGKYIFSLLVFSVSILGLTFLLNNITNNKYIKNAVSMVFSLGTALISGIMLPREYLGKAALKIAKFFPTYYFVQANSAQLSQISEFWVPVGIQLIFAVCFAVSGVYFAKIKREKGQL